MRDIAFLVFLAMLFGLGLKRPFLFVLIYAYIDLVAPQRLTYFLLNSVPLSMVAAGLALLSWVALDDKRDTRVAPRQGLLLLLLAYCWYTTGAADFPIEAQFKWEWAWKAMAFAIFLPLTLRTRLRIEALLLFMILSAAAIIITGGLKTVLSGGGYGALRLLVDNNSGLYEGSTASTVAIAIIPLILWFTRHGTVFPPDWRVKAFGFALVFACLLIPVGTSTRTGLVCIAALGVLTLRDVKRRALYIGLACAAGVAALPFLPTAFTERMGTIKSYQADTSASTRVAVWQWTWDYVQTKPMGGGFEAYRQNRIRYDAVHVQGEGAAQTVVRRPEIDEGRAYHSSYFEMLGEQGWPGLMLWLLIQVGGVVRMEVLRRRYARDEGEFAWVSPLASALQNGQIIYLVGSLFIAIAFMPFALMMVGVQIGLDTYLARRRKESSWRPVRRTARIAPAPQPA